MSQEQILFERTLHKINMLLKLTGLYLNGEDSSRSMIGRLLNRRFYCFNFIWVNSDLSGEITWFIEGIIMGKSLLELTYIGPCVTLTILGNLKAYYFIKYSHHVNDLVNSLRTLQSSTLQNYKRRDEVEYELSKKIIPFLHKVINAVTFINSMAIVTFTFGPLGVTISKYVNRGEVDLLLPFLIVYPFNARDIRIWPFVFIHQVWSAAVSIFTVVGPDCLYYACCAYINVQFRSLQYDLERIVKPDTNESKIGKSDPLWIEFLHLVNRHRELIRCVNLIEATYSKSTLFNFVTSSFLICLTGFNIMAISNIPLAVPFIIFLFMSLLQIYFFCYYGDMIMRSSMAVSNAVYDCQWWRVDAVMAKNMLFVLTRAQKPCKLTAYGFAEVNLRAFTRILSTAWSYFALLKTIYRA